MDQMMMQAPLLWLALGGVALAALIGGGGGHSAEEPDPEPEPEPEPVSPFENAPGYEPAEFGDEQIGTAADESLSADPAIATAIAGQGGDDRVNGSDQADYVLGGDGDDTVAGARGADSLHGEAGADVLDGGDGDDRIFAGAGDDLADGGAGNDLILGEGGADSLAGGTGADRIEGGAGDDVLSGLGQERAAPSDLNESLDDRGDTLSGGAGDDTLWLSAEDVGIGGEGADTFAVDHRVLQPGDPATITDYTPGEDAVVVHVRAIFDPSTGGLVPPELRTIGNISGGYTTILADSGPIARVEGIVDPTLIDLRRVVEGL